MMQDATTVIEYYKDTLLSQWVNQARPRGTIGTFVDCAVCDLLAIDVRDAFNIDTAVGPQLDVIGEYVNFGRTIYGEVVRAYFNMDDYIDPPVEMFGVTDYTDPSLNPNSVTWRYEFASAALYELEDEEYRFMVKLKAALNTLDNTLYAIETTLDTFFGSDISVFDAKDMTIGYYVADVNSRLAGIAASQGLLPKPMGVLINAILKVPNTSAVFGFQDYAITNGNTTGFGDYVGPVDSGRYFLSMTDAL
jgi:hypothetical protein